MNTRFRWQFEEEPEPAAAAPNKPRRWAATRVAIAMLVLVMAVAVGLGLLSQRRQQLEAVVTLQVTQAFELLQNAVAVGDEEVLNLVASPVNRDWRRTQKSLWRNGLYWDRPELGLLADGSPLPDSRIVVSPDGTAAALQFEQRYKLANQSDGKPDLTLTQTVHFGATNGNWYLATPDDAFWGPGQTYSGRFVSITFPDRDAALVLRLAEDLEQTFAEACSTEPAKEVCRDGRRLRLTLSGSDESLLELGRLPDGRSNDLSGEVTLPTPSLVGLPADETSYRALADAYIEPLVARFIAAPAQAHAKLSQPIRALCFDFPRPGQRLFRLEDTSRGWQEEQPGTVWTTMLALPKDAAMLLDKSRIMVLRNDVNPIVEVFELDGLAGARALGWTGSLTHPLIRFQQQGNGIATQPLYRWLNLETCREGACALSSPDGFVTASPSGNKLLVQDGSILSIRDAGGSNERSLGKGFSPFWIDETQFGFVRFGETDGGRVTTQVVIGNTSGLALEVLADGDALARSAEGAQTGDLFIDYVTPRPGAARELLVSATGIRGSAGRYFIFTVPLFTREGVVQPRLQLERTGAPGGLSEMLTPTGLPPFLPSSNGRWLVLTELQGHHKSAWTILVNDLQQGTVRQLADSVPAIPGNFPLLDWSADGEWLLIADRESVRLVAPERDQELIIPHDFESCSAVLWSR